MDASALFDIKISIETDMGFKDAEKNGRTAEQILQDVDHYRFIAPLGSTLHISITETK